MGAAALLVVALAGGSARAATRTVTSTADSGSGSLRATIAGANAGDVIVLPPQSSHYLVNTSEIQITKPLTIEGAGTDSSVVDAQGHNRVFEITSGVPAGRSVTFANLTITGGAVSGGTTGGGAIVVDGGAGSLALSGAALTGNSVNLSFGTSDHGGGGAVLADGAGAQIANSTLSGNTVTIDAPATAQCCSGGGAVYSSGPLSVQASLFAGNQAQFSASTPPRGGGGAVYENSSSAASYTNVTFAGNSTNAVGRTPADEGGGAVYVRAPTAPSPDSFLNVTIAGNSATSAGGGGLVSSGSAVDFKNTIAAANAASTGANCAGVTDGTNLAALHSLGHNLESANTCGFHAAGDRTGTDPRLGPLDENGGPTQTMALQPGSPAIDGGDNSGCPATDQRGVARPQGAACDIGAYEARFPAVTVQETGLGTGTVAGSGIACPSACTARVVEGATVDFAATPHAGSSFAGWSGACAGTNSNGPCEFTIRADQTAVARFNLQVPNTRITRTKVKRRKRSATFKFNEVGVASGFQCRLRRGSRSAKFRRCRSPRTYHHLRRGRYTFQVRAFNAAGRDRTPAKRRIRIG